MKNSLTLCALLLTALPALPAAETPQHTVRIHNGFVYAPAGIACVVDDQAAFVLDIGRAPGAKPQFLGQHWSASGCRPGIAAPDDSIHKLVLESKEANIQWVWGKAGDAAVGRISVDKPTTVTVKLLKESWPNLYATYTPTSDGVTGEATLQNGNKIGWRLALSTAPARNDGETLELTLDPKEPVRLVAGLGTLPKFSDVDGILERAEEAYVARRPSASGPWGDFVGAIADNLNNTRVYSTDNHRLAYTVSRKWAKGPNKAPYFGWDSFFNAALGCLDDPQAAQEMVRASLELATPQGFIANFSHWEFIGKSTSFDRSQPPVGSLCVWRMHQRRADVGFLREVYPKLVKWHAWWMTARDGNNDGLLEWGSNGNGWHGALLETGWDDTPHFNGGKMVGPNMNVNAVDLNSLYSMDAEYLALIADAIGEKNDAEKFRAESKAINQRINEQLWNEELGIYCSRMWGAEGKSGAFLTRLTPMNFYPLTCGAPDAERAKRVLKVMTDPKKFWGEWILPTLAYDDPLFAKQDYWNGKVWGPVNYLVFQGVKRYATPEVKAEFARKSVELFMQNWTQNGTCGENFSSTTGKQSSDPNYTWGALLCLVGVEAVIDQQPDGKFVAGQGLPADLKLNKIPLADRLYQVTVKNGIGVPTVEVGNPR